VEDIGPRKFEPVMRTLAVLSLHALGRFYQKSCRTEDAALFDTLRKLADAYDELIKQPVGAPIRVEVGDGAWVGKVDRMETSRGFELIINTRTYLSAGETAR
jgi:hypothetical protein